MAFMSSSVVTGLFLGKLSESETEMLTDNGKYAITETCLALTIFRNDLTPPIIVLFFALLFLKSFHWLCRSRVDRLEQVMPFGYLVHLRLFTFVLLLGASWTRLLQTASDMIARHRGLGAHPHLGGTREAC